MEKLETIRKTVESYYGFSIKTPSGVKGNNRECDAKKHYSLLSVRLTRHTLSDIGKPINRQHPAVGNLRTSGFNLLDTDKVFKDDYEILLTKAQEQLKQL